MLLPRQLARFNRSVTNRVLGPLADLTPPFVWVEHRGRRSGRTYRTPIWAWRTDEGFVVALTYGRKTEWLQNVLAAGGCRFIRRNRAIPVGNPRVVGPERALPLMPPGIRSVLRALRVESWLLLDD